MTKITAIIPTLNEEDNIQRAINSVLFADEIIVIDSFSTDKTVEIVNKNERVTLLQRKFDDFSSQKNFAIHKASNEWVLILDADEEVSKDLISEIKKSILNPREYNGFYIYRKMFFFDKQIRFTGFQRSRVIRLFKKSKCFYKGKVHEVLVVKGSIGKLKNKIKHYSYIGFDKYKNKLNLYAKLQAQDLFQNNQIVTPYHLYIKPIIRFLLHFVFKFGFLDGKKGLTLSYLQAYGVYKRYVELKTLKSLNILKNNFSDDIENVPQIDAVITWVDGNDPTHRKKMEFYIDDKESLKNNKLRTRFDQVNEIEFSVQSILKYAKFVRRIFIVTDNQIPDFLKGDGIDKYPMITIVDHKEIFKDHLKYLPTFNCLPIESLLYKTPNLSEHFLYFNDDLFLCNPTKLSDFFINGNPVIRGKWSLFYEDIWHKKLHKKLLKIFGKKGKKNIYGYKKGQQTIAKELGFKKYVRLDHTVAALRKSTFREYYDQNNGMLERNIKHRFRHPEQYTNQSLANHLEILNNSFYLKRDYQLLYFQNYKKPLLWLKYKLNFLSKNKNILFLCMQSLDQTPESKFNFIKKWLYKKYFNED